MAAFTLQDLQSFLGTPIVLLTVFRKDTQRFVQLTIEDLPPTQQQFVINWINNHLP